MWSCCNSTIHCLPICFFWYCFSDILFPNILDFPFPYANCIGKFVCSIQDTHVSNSYSASYFYYVQLKDSSPPSWFNICSELEAIFKIFLPWWSFHERLIVLKKYGFSFWNHHRFSLLWMMLRDAISFIGCQSYTARNQSAFLGLVANPSN